MAVPVIMPKQGQSVETCIITEWHKKKGDEVKLGDILFGYETDKASFEVEAEAEGILLEVFFKDGDEVPVLCNVAVIGKSGEPIEMFRPEGLRPSVQADEKVEEIEIQVNDNDEIMQKEETITDKIKISPLARRLAEQSGINYQQLTGTGPNGRIIKRDIESAAIQVPQIKQITLEVAEKQIQKSTESRHVDGKMQSSDSSVAANMVYINDFEVKKLSNIRKIIAKNMHQSLQNSAQVTHHLSADVRKLLAYRKRVKEAISQGSTDNITLNDMICFAVIRALVKHPDVNSHFLNDTIKTFKKVHLGYAVDTPRGLMVPTLKNADDLSLKGLSAQMKVLAERCRNGNINIDLLASDAASFTVSNLGNYGVEMFTPVINLPQVGILGVNTIIHRPVEVEEGVWGFVPHIGLSLTYDHRAIDGGPATLFLAEIKREIENFVIY